MAQEKTYILYRIINLVNRKFYIGRTSQPLYKSWSAHKAHAKYGKKYKRKSGGIMGESYLHRAMRKYGIENFEIKEIDRAKDFKHQSFLEQFYIKYYDSITPKYGYNSTINGYGDGLKFVSEETKDKIRKNNYLKQKRFERGVSWDKFRNKWVLGFEYKDLKIRRRFNDKNDAIFYADILYLHFYKELAVLIKPENLEQYKSVSAEEVIKKLTETRKRKSSYLGVYTDKEKYSPRLSINKKMVYFGIYNSEEEAALIRDKICYYLYSDSKGFNFPEMVCESHIKEGKDIFDFYLNPSRQRAIKRGKTSNFTGVSKRSPKTWEMSFTLNGEKIREVYENELDAGRAFDFYCRRNQVKLEKLNFKDEEIFVKPKEKNINTRNKL